MMVVFGIISSLLGMVGAFPPRTLVVGLRASVGLPRGGQIFPSLEGTKRLRWIGSRRGV